MFSQFTMAALTLSLAFGFLFPTAHAAKIHHWVDDKGQAHYSENPPREITSKELNINATGTGSAGTAAMPSVSKTATKPKSTTTDGGGEIVSEHSPEDKATYCQQSRDLLQQMSNNTQRRFEQPDGSYRKLEQAEIADYQAKAQEGINSYCQ